MNGLRTQYPKKLTVSQCIRLERFKIGFQYTLTLVASLILGYLLPRFLGSELESWQIDALTRHFALPFASLSTLPQMLGVILSFAAPSLFCLVIIFLFSFSSLNCLMNNGVLIYSGMRTGYTFSVLVSLLGDGVSATYQPGAFRFAVFIAFKILLLLLMLRYAFRSSDYSYHLRRYSASGRPFLHAKTILTLTGYTILIAVAVFAVHMLYVWILYLLSS